MYAVEFSHRSGRDLINVAKKRTNVIPIIEDARHPHKYRMLVGKQRILKCCTRSVLKPSTTIEGKLLKLFFCFKVWLIRFLPTLLNLIKHELSRLMHTTF